MKDSEEEGWGIGIWIETLTEGIWGFWLPCWRGKREGKEEPKKQKESLFVVVGRLEDGSYFFLTDENQFKPNLGQKNENNGTVLMQITSFIFYLQNSRVGKQVQVHGLAREVHDLRG